MITIPCTDVTVLYCTVLMILYGPEEGDGLVVPGDHPQHPARHHQVDVDRLLRGQHQVLPTKV